MTMTNAIIRARRSLVAVTGCILFASCGAHTVAPKHASSNMTAASAAPSIELATTTRASTTPSYSPHRPDGSTASRSTAHAMRTSVAAQPGSYTYDVTSTSSGPPPQGGSVSEKAKLRIDHAQGSDQHTAVADDQGNGEQYEYRYLDSGIEVLELKFTGQFDKDFRPSDEATYAPIPASPGTAWSWDMTSTDHSSTMHAEFKVSRRDTVIIGREPIDVVVVVGTVTIRTSYNAAPITIEIRTTKWISLHYKLTVKRHDISDVPAFNNHSDTTDVLESVHPK